MAFDPFTGLLQLAGGAANIIGGSGAAGSQKKLMDEQLRLARQQHAQYNQLQPEYMQALQSYGQNQGFLPGGPQGYGNTQISPHNAQRLGMDPNTQFTNPMAPNAQNGYLSNPYEGQAFHLRQSAAEQALQHQTQNADQNLMFQLGQRGISTGTQAAALARSHQDALQQYGDWQRNMAINAGDRQQQQQQQWLAMLQGGMGAGQQASGVLGQQAGVYGSQANQMFGGAGQIAGNYIQNQAMQQAMQQMYGGGQQGGGYGGGGVSTGDIFGGSGAVQPPLDPELMKYLQMKYNNGPMGIGT